MPYDHLRKGSHYGLRNRETNKTIWYDPDKVRSFKKDVLDVLEKLRKQGDLFNPKPDYWKRL